MAYTIQEILSDEENTLRLYFDDIAESRPLSREREVELSARIQEGDMEARDELVQANLRFVIDVAKNYQNRGLSLSDLISAGNVGLLTAAERFDGTKGYKFISYAVWWIKQSILQTIAEHARTVRLPLNKLSLLKDISKASRKLGQGRESEPDVEEIAAELDVPAQEILDTMLSARTVRSLDESFEEDDERSLLNILADNNQETPDSDVITSSARTQLEEVLESLDERELRIIRLYFGLDGTEALTLEQIGGLMGLTRERVRQLKERALGKLRHPTRYQALLALVDSTEVY
ncbi:MAG: RNA polymerase sigma factor RpoD/SigA [Gemmatimonadetes bacterium]|jgi:RNA polymerase primary sigma factor|nr:RNA polymerase sigma factor RpoD/SigA [Gemmatimonadota bacterium]MDE0962509.1 RNA polymerase sigma factor RpoD/SigA [Candidatus Latescibacterota bacterium]MBT5452309.1 RNA polymerase sigma factor RpoD/SigA [Gemmatimonadota bacterium]MBT6620046.1 RNA polymerase sigma factor RpoD/SigA [Gemmatimonadota bacterium]MBT6906779.1 RNA polymerase sigma factor RpoD/SigA [Gemmatimonadota bacterium]|tara:strand:+ start:200 stop:1072 length:873 start_codon:yes stop_codon:yes gene_type:complete